MQEWKIKALMIYYDHWGKDEIRARKTVYGIKKTMRSLDEWFPTEEEETLKCRLKKMFEYNDTDVVFWWNEFAEVFLGEAMCFENDEFFVDPDELLFDRKVMLEDKLNILNEDTADMIYDNDFGYKNVMSVDAIVALM